MNVSITITADNNNIPHVDYFAMAAILNLSNEVKIEIIEKYFGKEFSFDYNNCSDFYKELFKLHLKY